MPFKKIAIIASSLVLVGLLLLFAIPSSQNTSNHSGKSALSQGFSSLSGLLGFDSSSSSSSSNAEDGPIPVSLLRNETQDNLYWVAVATPRDAGEVKAQNELREHWATLYGKIYSGKATRKEIDEYFTGQIKLQQDQLDLLRFMEDRYPERLNDDMRRMILAGKELYAKKLNDAKEEYKKYVNNK